MAPSAQLSIKATPFGTVPNHWGVMPLRDCAEVQTGIAKGRHLDTTDAVRVPYLRVANVQDGFLDLAEIKHIDIRESELARYSLQPGDVLLTEGGDFDKLGRGFVWTGNIPTCVHQNHIFAVRPKRTLLTPEFLSLLVQSNYGKSYFLSVAHKTTNLACINTSKLKAFPALVPPLGEQHAIARALRAVREVMDTTRRELEFERERKAALMQRLFTRGTRGERTKQTEIGEMPESWTIKRLGEVITLHRGFDLPIQQRQPGPVPVVSSSGVTGSHSVRKVKGPGVVTGRYGTIGEVFLIQDDFWPLNTTLFVSDFKGNEPEFIAHLLQMVDLRSLNDKTSVPGINRNHAHRIWVGLPSIEEQQAITQIPRAVDQKLEKLEREATLLDELFRALLEELMSGRLSAAALVEPVGNPG